MKLALDASQTAGSIALWHSGRLVYSAYFDIRITHSETLMPEVDHALKVCGFAPEDIKTLLLVIGPGSFTGLRIGLATAKGIAYGLKIPLLVYDSLLLNALVRYNCGSNILVTLDAKMQQVYAALYDQHLNVLKSPQVCRPEEICAWDLAEPYLAGNCSGLISAHLDALGLKYRPVLPEPICASGLFTLATLFPQQEKYNLQQLAELEPLYLRESTAQIKKKGS